MLATPMEVTGKKFIYMSEFRCVHVEFNCSICVESRNNENMATPMEVTGKKFIYMSEFRCIHVEFNCSICVESRNNENRK